MNAAIVGCGNIAGFLDTPDSLHVTTHAHAYLKHPRTSLVAVCDPDKTQREKFQERWGSQIHIYSSLEVLLEKEDINILSICSPTSFHADALHKALKDSNITHIVCEKPFVESTDEMDTLAPLLKQSDKKILINFIRHYDPSTISLKKMIQKGELGELLHFSGNFTKGLYHNGSHMLELIEHLCGDICSIRSNILTCKESDLFGSFYIETTSTHGTVQNENGDNYALFELELIFSKARVQIKDSGHKIYIERIKPSKHYPGYFNLEQEQQLEDTLQFGLLNTIDSIVQSRDNSTAKKHLSLSKKLLTIKEHLANTHYLEFT